MTTADVMPDFGLGPVEQISFAVRDLDTALGRYEAIFERPFRTVDVPVLDVMIGGKARSVSLRLAFAMTGLLEIELVQVVDGPWPALRWLEEHGEGLHHLGFHVPNVAISSARLEAAGCVRSMVAADGHSFAYLETPMLNGMTIELLQRPALTRS